MTDKKVSIYKSEIKPYPVKMKHKPWKYSAEPETTIVFNGKVIKGKT